MQLVARPKVLGVDGWAKRKEQSYGAILVDPERRCPIDLLPDRESATLAASLQTHPGIEIPDHLHLEGSVIGLSLRLQAGIGKVTPQAAERVKRALHEQTN